MILLLLGCRSVLVPDVPAPVGDVSEAWEAVLREVVTEDGLVDYDLLAARRRPLEDYVAWLGRDRPRVDRENGQHALWLNAYNALVLYAVLEDGRPASVMDVPGWLPIRGSGFFFERAFVVQQERVSLWEIEHERLRGRMQDFRDHGGISCASMSCPPLRAELYRSRDTDEQLRDQMQRWMADDARGVRIEDGMAVFNPIFDWYAWDFEFFSVGDDPCELAARFAPPGKAERLEQLSREGCPRRFFEYDWSLNDAGSAR